MGKVRIYIKTDLAGIKAKIGRYDVKLEYELKTGKTATLELAGEVTGESVTRNELVLNALNAAFGRMTKTGCDIEIFTDNKNIISGWNCGWIHSWKSLKWKNAKGNEVAHVQLWKSIYDQLNSNKVVFTYKESERGNKGRNKRR